MTNDKLSATNKLESACLVFKASRLPKKYGKGGIRREVSSSRDRSYIDRKSPNRIRSIEINWTQFATDLCIDLGGGNLRHSYHDVIMSCVVNCEITSWDDDTSRTKRRNRDSFTLIFIYEQKSKVFYDRSLQ